MSSTETSRVRRPGFDAQPPAVESPGRGRRLWSVLPVCAGFAVFGVVVWLAYQDAGLGRPSGEPPLIRAAPEPIKLPPEQAEEPALAAEQGGAVGRLWSDGEQADQPERLLPTPEEPLSPPSGEPPAGVAQTTAPPHGRSAGAPNAPGAAPGAAGEASDTGTAPPAPAQASAAAPPPASDESLQEAETALDRLLAEVTAMSEDKDAPGATAAAPSEDQGAVATRSEDQSSAAAPSDASPTGAPPPAATAAATTTRTPPVPPAPPQRPALQLSAAATAGTEMRPAGARAGAPASNAPPPGSTETAALAPAPAPPPTAADGEFRIQLAAVRGEADARRAWDLFAADLGSVLRGVQPIFERADTTNGVFYRVQVGPFASQDAAESLCERLKQQNASCFVIRR
jgi:hypothetical protein